MKNFSNILPEKDLYSSTEVSLNTLIDMKARNCNVDFANMEEKNSRKMEIRILLW